jgi:type I restriction enzyme S subunit
VGDVCQIFGRIGYRGYTVDDIVSEGEGAITISPSNIVDGRTTFKRSTYISWKKWEESPEIQVVEGDILLVKTGSTVGKTATVRGLSSKATINPQLVVLKHCKVNDVFLGYVVASEAFQSQIASTVVGGALPTLSQRQVENYKFLCPDDAAEQRTIAHALQEADALISTLGCLIAKKQAFKQGMMQQLITGNTRLQGYGGVWTNLRLTSLIGKLEAGVSVNSVSGPGHCAVLKTSCVSGGRFLPSESKTVAPSDIGRVRVSPVTNSLIISRMNTPALVGEVGYVAADWPHLFLPDRLWLATPSQTTPVDMRWLGYLLSSTHYSVRLKELANGTSGSMKNLAKTSLLNLIAPCPPKEEQVAISRVLTDLDRDLDNVKDRLAKAESVKRGMMQELLAGRTRLPVEEGAA